jgi:hypothetical protein
MPRYERLEEKERDKRRTIADVIEVLRRRISDDRLRARIQVGRLRLPSDEVVGLVNIFAESAADQTVFIVSLPTSAQFRAKHQGSSETETFAIFQLDGAMIDDRGGVELLDGTRLRAVDVIPALLPNEVTELDWRIVRHTIACIEAADECYTYVLPFAESCYALDCRTLPALRDRIPLLKQIKAYIAEREPALNTLSEQQIANTLRKFGMRIPQTRPRRARDPRPASPS